jgi:hypothetical protein
LKNSKSIVSLLIIFALSLITVSARAQGQSSRSSNRQAGLILQRIERDSLTFYNSLREALAQRHIDQTRSQNNINVLQGNFQNATRQLREQLTARQADESDVLNVLQTASLVNGFMGRNRLTTRVQNDWGTVRTDLNSLANAFGVSWQWTTQETLPPVNASRSSRLSNSELNQLIQRIDIGGDTFRSSLTEAFGQSPYDRTSREGDMNQVVRRFKSATEQLRNQFDAGQPVIQQVEAALARAIPIDTYMQNNRVTNNAQSDWSAVRRDLNTLAAAYEIAALGQNSNQQTPMPANNNQLSGTFRLDSSRSDNPRDIAERATRNLSESERESVYSQIMARLESPQMLAIERRGSTITLASSLAPQTTFEADARERQEQIGNGRSTRVTATLRGDQLVVSSNGYKENDFNVTFDATGNNGGLRVRRQIFSDRLTQPLVVDSVYDRTSDVAEWNVYDRSLRADQPVVSNGEFIVRDGESVVASLNDDLTTQRAKQGDQFSLTLRSPDQYEGAIIEGTVGSVEQSGRLTGRSGMTLNFNSIRMSNGQTYRFAGVLESVRMVNGDTVKIDNEGSAQGDNQTTQTVQRSGIGTAIGAIVGAIAGGAKGAVIGGIIGATAGAGSVYVQGKENLELPRGTELTIRASAPR